MKEQETVTGGAGKHQAKMVVYCPECFGTEQGRKAYTVGERERKKRCDRGHVIQLVR